MNQEFLYHYLTSIRGRETIKRLSGGLGEKLHINNCKFIKIPIISMKEQVQIKTVLNLLDEIIEKSRQITEETIKLKHGIMQQVYMEEPKNDLTTRQTKDKIVIIIKILEIVEA